MTRPGSSVFESLDTLEVGLAERRELRDGVAQHGQRRPGLDGQRCLVNPFAGERGDRPGSDEHLALAVGDEAEVAARVLLVGPRAGDRVGQADVRGGDVDALIAGLLLGEPDGCDLRVREDDARDGRVTDASGWVLRTPRKKSVGGP